MRPDSPYYLVCSLAPCIGIPRDLKYDSVPGTNGQTQNPVPGELTIEFNVEGRTVRKWPQVFRTTAYIIYAFVRPIADQVIEAGFTGVEFHPVRLNFGALGRLKGQEDLCPEYVWCRALGLLLVDVTFDNEPARVDPTGMYLLNPEDLRRRGSPKTRLREEQPYAADFCRVAPRGAGDFVVSKRVAEFFDRIKIKGIDIVANHDWLRGGVG